MYSRLLSATPCMLCHHWACRADHIRSHQITSNNWAHQNRREIRWEIRWKISSDERSRSAQMREQDQLRWFIRWEIRWDQMRDHIRTDEISDQLRWEIHSDKRLDEISDERSDKLLYLAFKKKYIAETLTWVIYFCNIVDNVSNVNILSCEYLMWRVLSSLSLFTVGSAYSVFTHLP